MSVNEPRTRGGAPETRTSVDTNREVRTSYTPPARRQYADTDHDTDEDFRSDIQPASNLFKDRVRWGPIFAGAFTALSTLLILSLLGLAIGLTSINPNAAAVQGLPEGSAATAGIWAGLSALIAFFLGGYVAGGTAAIFSRPWGALNGALVFLFAVPLTLWLAGQGLGAIVGGVGGFAADFLGPINPNNVNVTPGQVAQTTANVRDAAWNTFLALSLGLLAATAGGALGVRRNVEMDRDTGQVSD